MRMDSIDYQMAQVLDIQMETAAIKSYLFTCVESKIFRFSPGQFNMIGLPGVGEAAISFSSLAIPGSNQFTHTIAGVGNVTRFLERLEIGRRVLFRGPFGRGWPIEEIIGKDLLIVAGGIGLAPLRSFLFYCLENRNRIRDVVLVYGARTTDDMVFAKDLADWQARDDIETIYCVDQYNKESSLRLQVGLVTRFLEKLELDYRNTLAFLCGPEIMMRFVARNLLFQGYAGDQIYVSLERRMRCGTGHCGHCQIGAKFVCQDGPVFQYSDISRFADTLL